MYQLYYEHLLNLKVWKPIPCKKWDVLVVFMSPAGIRNDSEWWSLSFVFILLLMLLFGSGWVEWEVIVAWVGLRESAAAVGKGKEGGKRRDFVCIDSVVCRLPIVAAISPLGLDAKTELFTLIVGSLFCKNVQCIVCFSLAQKHQTRV